MLKVKGLFSFGSEKWHSFEGHSDFFPRQKEKEEVLCVTAVHAKAWARGNAEIEDLKKSAGALVWRLDGAQEVGRSQAMLGLTVDPAIEFMGSHLCSSWEGLLH